MNATPEQRLTIAETLTLNRWSPQGGQRPPKASYPITKLGNGWALEGFPTVFPTKKAAVTQWDRHIDLLMLKKDGGLE